MHARFIFGILAAGGLTAATARADVGLAPRISLAAGADSNYAYRATEPVAAAVAGGEAGLTVYWVPTLRHRLSWEASGDTDALQPLTDPLPARESASLLQTRLGWSYLTSLRTRFDAAAGVYRYQAAEILDRRITYGGDAYLGLTVHATESLDTGIGALGGIDADEAAAPDAHNDTAFNGLLWVRWSPHWRFALDLRGTAGQTASDHGTYGFAAMGGAAGLELRPWRSGTLGLHGGWRRRRYAARIDRRVAAEADFSQAVGDWNKIVLSALYLENRSDTFPYERSTARLQWVFEPDFWF